MKKTPNILMAEDDHDDVFLAKRAIKESKKPLNFSVVKDGEELLTELKNRFTNEKSTFPDLILIDIDMPKIDGIEALEKIRKSSSFQNIPIVMLTTSSNKSDIEVCYSLGANSYLIKPKSLPELTRIFDVLQTYWFETVQSPGIAEKHNYKMEEPKCR
ncbi:response regulator [Acanthopleuribacter pedis]|uniref:Response regulator n=1 Tax=Acanthopleuribacter pedis TaxID=442870 RepID=A0A8J7U1V1_9BACT|nr:response regulator [Acanthopleuribacter pedis]MBO1317281.1 response regulator [Acanthopleuribacter pedis]MBO1318588.1 response regulator [Acanthopleuribacter pedis]